MIRWHCELIHHGYGYPLSQGHDGQWWLVNDVTLPSFHTPSFSFMGYPGPFETKELALAAQVTIRLTGDYAR